VFVLDTISIARRRFYDYAPCAHDFFQVIIWVELTREQRAYYKGLYNRDIATLLSGASHKNLPNMRNLAMELRKVCCHPYLCNGLETDISAREVTTRWHYVLS
jgi:hypothetical protein